MVCPNCGSGKSTVGSRVGISVCVDCVYPFVQGDMLDKGYGGKK